MRKIENNTSISEIADLRMQLQLTSRLLRYMIPLSCNIIKACVTARVIFGSIMKQARSQSTPAPSFRSWS